MVANTVAEWPVCFDLRLRLAQPHAVARSWPTLMKGGAPDMPGRACR